MISFSTLSYLDVFLLVVGSWTLYKFTQAVRLRVKTTKLKGPPSSSWIFGVTKELSNVTKEVSKGDSGALYEQWAKEYGPVYQIPTPLGGRRTILTDPKAVAHFYSKETFTYVQSNFSKRLIESLLGRGLLWSEGESHRRQRKTLTPAFSNAAIRSLTPVMNCVSLDSIGIAGFGHDFGALQGKRSSVEEVLDSFGTAPPMSMVVMLLGQVIPILQKLPTTRGNLMRKLHDTMGGVSEQLLERSRKEKALGGGVTDTSRSIIGSLLRAENADSELRLTPEEALAQMKVLILAGYETTSISLTWALIELSLHPEKQDKLYLELAEFTNKDPTYDQLTSGLPYLDSVTREVLRLHPPLAQSGRVAKYDDIIPLSTPITTTSGKQVDHIAVAQGSAVFVSIRAINRSEEIWGPDAKEFKPERWLDNESGLTPKAKEVQGYHHILSFVDGPRTCLGRAFAIAEFKSVLSVLIRNYAFSLRDGPETKIDRVTTLLPRPKVAGEPGYAMPMRLILRERETMDPY
ncbi:cytochrome P450 [Sanghuangporus baumii]|uniref:Cytochrome P450 n=1 Tax=Sanghuangporus baumii TaxID=108892 RepID=A0A9Q5I5P7_SANBA|nr:cytochrome P450 [Sanghuangporus baumii]